MAAAVLLAITGTISSCQHHNNKNELDEFTLTIAQHGQTDSEAPVSMQALANNWIAHLPPANPTVIATKDFTDNVTRLRSGGIDIALATADIATEAAASGQPGGRNLRALTWMHTDYVRLTVREKSPVRTPADLRGQRVTINVAGSEHEMLATRLLDTASIDAAREHLPSLEGRMALLDNRFDASFLGNRDNDWNQPGLRHLDLSDVMPPLRARYPAYARASSTTSAVMVPVLLLTTDAMPDNVAEALTRTLLEPSVNLVGFVNHNSIRPDLARDTMPIPLHPGAQKYYRSLN